MILGPFLLFIKEKLIKNLTLVLFLMYFEYPVSDFLLQIGVT
jgi:hypothetical protein